MQAKLAATSKVIVANCRGEATRVSSADDVARRVMATPSQWRPGTAPPVYRPQAGHPQIAPPAVQPKIAPNRRAVPPAPPPVYRPNVTSIAPSNPRPAPAPAPAQPAGAVQCVILKGKTYRSQAIGTLKNTKWYKNLPDDDHKAFALLLHAGEDEEYTKVDALKEIKKRIKRGDDVPALSRVTAKAIRMERVRKYINSNAPDEKHVSYKHGRILSLAGGRAYRRHFKKFKKTDDYKDNRKIVNAIPYGLFSDQKEVLSGKKPWEQVVAVSRSKPQTFNINLGGSEVTLDSIDYTANDDRKRKRKDDEVNLNQFFIEQPRGENSYWKISDNKRRKLWDEREHQQLRHLEAERDENAVFTTYFKDALFSEGLMTHEEAYGDENPFTYQEYKGALSDKRSQNMRRMQTSSAYRALTFGLTHRNRALGRRVNKRPQTTPENISTALDTFMKDQNETNYKVLVKENYRLIRSMTERDQDSDTESDSDTDY